MRVCLVFLLTLLQGFCYSQTRLFQHITSVDGISQSEIYSFLEDSRGFMWFGTVDGLNRYDGYNLTIFNTDKNDPNSISNNTIRSLLEDGKNRIWIGSDDGLSVYDPMSETVYQVHIPQYDSILLPIHSMVVDDNDLLLGTSVGLLRTKIDTDDLESIGSATKVIKLFTDEADSVIVMEPSKSGGIWVASKNRVYRIVFQKKTSKPILIESVLLDEVNSLKGMKEDFHGNLWMVSYTNGFFRYNQNTKVLSKFVQNPSNPSIVSNNGSSVAIDNNGNLWLGTRDKGLLFLESEYLNDENPQFENVHYSPMHARSLNSNLIYSLYVSEHNLLWVGTIGSGINIYDPRQKSFNYYRIQEPLEKIQSGSSFIRAVYSDNSDNIWIGTHNNGLFILDRKSNTSQKVGFGTQSIYYITDIGEGNILICTSEGFSLVKRVKNKFRIINSINSGACFNAVKSNENVVWIAGLNGLWKYKIENGKLKVEDIFNRVSKPAISFINCRVLFYHKEENQLMVGTEGGGLNILQLNENHDPISNTVYKKSPSLNTISSNYVRSITMDNKRVLWIGTYEGLNKIIRDPVTKAISFKSYTKNDGLPNNMIQLLIGDDLNKLWIGTNGGLCSFDPQSEKFVSFSVSEGIQSNEFSEHAVYKKSDGEIIVGGINGINTFYPKKIAPNNVPPRTTITGFYLFNKKVVVNQKRMKGSPLQKSITLTDTIVLKPKMSSLGFDFSAMLHSNPEKVKYAYMLEGFDTEWNLTDARNRRANYTNLLHGEYTFKVKSSNTDGQWEEIPREIFIRIKTPFLYTWVAFAIYVVILVAIIVFFTNFTAIRYTTKKEYFLKVSTIKSSMSWMRYELVFLSIFHMICVPHLL